MRFICAAVCTLLGFATAVPFCAAQSGAGYGNSALGGFTPQPTSTPAVNPGGNLSSEIQRGFGEATSQFNQQLTQGATQAGQQTTGAVQGAFDSLGNAIARPIQNIRQTTSDLLAAPPTLTPSSGRPVEDVLNRTGDGLEHVGDALRDSWNRTGQNARELVGLNNPNTAGTATANPNAVVADPLRNAPTGWNATPVSNSLPATSNPPSWGTANDPLAVPPSLSRSNPNTASQPLSAPVQPTADTRPAWSNTGTDTLQAPPVLQPNNQQPNYPYQQQQPQQPANPQSGRMLDPIVERGGPMLGDPAIFQPRMTPVPGAEVSNTSNAGNPWPTTTATSGFGSDDPLTRRPSSNPPQFQPTSGTEQFGMAVPEIRNSANTPVADTSKAVETWMDQNGAGNKPESPELSAERRIDPLVQAGWILPTICLVGSIVGNFYQWFNILDLRNKYRVALRRNSPSLARTLNA